eukprot:752620-Hanusia_phi.AAC.1
MSMHRAGPTPGAGPTDAVTDGTSRRTRVTCPWGRIRCQVVSLPAPLLGGCSTLEKGVGVLFPRYVILQWVLPTMDV